MKKFILNESIICWLLGMAALLVGKEADLPLLLLVSPVFFLRFMYLQELKRGFLSLWISLSAANLFLYREVASSLFESVPVYIAVFSVASFLGMIPLVLDKVLSPGLRLPYSTLIYPAARTILEYLSSLNSPFGLWSSPASHFGDCLPLAQLVPITGIWGLSFILSWNASLIHHILKSDSWKERTMLSMLYSGCLLLLFGFGLLHLNVFEPSGDRVKVASITLPENLFPKDHDILQKYYEGKASVQEISALETAYRNGHAFLMDKVEEASAQGARIICWAEGNARMFEQGEKAFIAEGKKMAVRHKVCLAMSVNVIHRRKDFPVENKLIFIHPDGKVAWQYHKRHPFGTEKKEMMQGADTLMYSDTPYGRIAGVICYDTDFIQFIRKAGRNRVDILLAPSNDWPAVAEMRAKITPFRALENGCMLIRPASHGISEIVDYQGRMIRQVDYLQDSASVIVQEIHTRRTSTLYSSTGDVLPLLCMLFVVASALTVRRKQKRKPFPLKALVVMILVITAQTASAQSADTSIAAKNRLHLFPAVTYAPETSLGLGLSAVKLFHTGSAGRTSNITATAIYTFKNQILLDAGTTTFLDQEKWMIRGKVNYKKFPEFFYGIGENTSGQNKELVSYEYYNLYAAGLRKLRKGLFAGMQASFNRYYKIKTEAGKVIDSNVLPGSHGARNTGLGLMLLYDTRDNVLNATRGTFIELSGMSYRKAWGAQFNYQSATLDVRKYFTYRNHTVFALQFLGLAKQGTIPFLQLSYLGGSDIMRGFYSGRYRDKDLLAMQAEYRRQLSDKWGFVLFAGIGNVTDKLPDFDFSYLKNSLGLGLRRTIDKKERVNLRMDLGFGNGHPNFYVNIAEAF